MKALLNCHLQMLLNLIPLYSKELISNLIVKLFILGKEINYTNRLGIFVISQEYYKGGKKMDSFSEVADK